MEKTATLHEISHRISEIDELVFRGNTGQIPMTIEQRAKLEAEAKDLMDVLAQALSDNGAGPYQTVYDMRRKLRQLALITATGDRYKELHPGPQPEVDAIFKAAFEGYNEKTPEEQRLASEMIAAVYSSLFVELSSKAPGATPTQGWFSRFLRRTKKA